jgi:serine/threonine protein kinase
MHTSTHRAPEYRLTKKSDIFSAACLILELLSADTPCKMFQYCAGPHDDLYKIMIECIDKREFPLPISKELFEVIHYCMRP